MHPAKFSKDPDFTLRNLVRRDRPKESIISGYCDLLINMSLPNTNVETQLHLTKRPRRLRRNPSIRSLVSETKLTVDDLIYPMFVMEGENQRVEIASMPGCYR